MSEINKPEVTEIENKLPEHKSLNPDQYKCNHVVAPENSCPWAIIQVYLGNQARRGDWDSPNECIRLISESNANSEGNNLIYIEKCDKHGHWLPWQPTPEDIMSSDWSLLEPDNNMMVFDVTLGTGKNDGNNGWGYKPSWDKNSDWPNFGTLNVIQNKTDIVATLSFFWNEGTNTFIWNIFSRENEEIYLKVEELFKAKDLYITVDGITFNLGKGSSTIKREGYRSVNWYEGNEAQKLGAILKQTGETKRFYCNWC
ncbi:Thoeris anti-defense Tad2 family protein [Photorhabdus laumondii]|uniref:DUF2829 domain-containing protein n=1 Tax=Photorhabdus laumondii subsp. clarkei TaxID=2029685 RepID=A0A329VGN0_9GAMM|nr:MW1434 family type I TA system toxin [Photorhabdus laumondii]RAW91406.1 hypothetical protein CKY01_09200 [Photorhabdus laumondii subsp. clarkei]